MGANGGLRADRHCRLSSLNCNRQENSENASLQTCGKLSHALFESVQH